MPCCRVCWCQHVCGCCAAPLTLHCRLVASGDAVGPGGAVPPLQPVLDIDSDRVLAQWVRRESVGSVLCRRIPDLDVLVAAI